MGTTPQHFNTIPRRCTILPTMHTTKLSTCALVYSHPLNIQIRQSPLFTSQPSAYKISAMFSSNKISQHNLYSNMPYRLSTTCALHMQLLHTRQTISAMLSSNYFAATHNKTHSPCTSTCTTYPALPNPLPSTTILCTQLTQGILGKMAQDVGIV